MKLNRWSGVRTVLKQSLSLNFGLQSVTSLDVDHDRLSEKLIEKLQTKVLYPDEDNENSNYWSYGDSGRGNQGLATTPPPPIMTVL